MRLSRYCADYWVLAGNCARLQCTAKVRRRNTYRPPKHLREVARVLVANVEADLDQAALGFADELLGVCDPFARDELQRGHAGGLLEDAREMKRTEPGQVG